MSIRVLTSLNENASQHLSFITSKGEKVELSFRYAPSQETWFVDVKSDSLTIYGLALTAFANLLDPYHNKIDWGLYVWSKDGFDPWRIDDFTSERIKVAILESVEHDLTQEFLNSGNAL